MNPIESLRDCALCPRECHVDRLAGERGYCQTGADFSIGSICLHRGEEPPVSGAAGICNVFFTHCNLQCLYCQNHQISRNAVSSPEFSLSLEKILDEIGACLDQGAHAVGFVSPSHVLPQMETIMLAMGARGRRPRWVYNTNAYDKAESLRRFEGRLDVFLPDFKYMDPGLAASLSGAPNYPEVARAALREMFRQKGTGLILDDQGRVQSGLIIRHLILPGQVENSLACLRFIAEELSPRVTVSLMSQYTPMPAVAGHPELSRALLPGEYEAVMEEMDRLGLENGWAQELESAYHYHPDFECNHPFEGKPASGDSAR